MCTKIAKVPDSDGLFSVVAGGMTLGKLFESQCPPALQECPKNASDLSSPGPEPAKVKRVALT